MQGKQQHGWRSGVADRGKTRKNLVLFEEVFATCKGTVYLFRLDTKLTGSFFLFPIRSHILPLCKTVKILYNDNRSLVSTPWTHTQQLHPSQASQLPTQQAA